MSETTLTELHQKIDADVKAAIAEAIEKHRRLGESISLIKGRQIVTLTADQISPKDDKKFIIYYPKRLRSRKFSSSQTLSCQSIKSRKNLPLFVSSYRER